MKFNIYAFFFIAAISLTSCNEVIDLTLDDPEPVLVVDGFISNIDTIQYVKLSSLENYFSNEVPNYSIYKTAKVYLLENGVKVDTFNFEPTTEQFETRYQGLVAKEYQVDITLPDGTRYISAAEIMEPTVPIDSIWAEVNSDPGGPGPAGEDVIVFINTVEPAGIGDNYQWKSYVNEEYLSGAEDLFFIDDRFVDGQPVNDFEVFGMSGTTYNEYLENSTNGKVIVRIEQIRISYRYLKYLQIVAQQLVQVGGPFAAPPAEIRGNVYKQGETEVLALGYFYTAGIATEAVDIVK
jgi:hypothetical protein